VSAGAFSDPAVIEASKKIVCVFVDCDWGNKHKDLSDKVKGYPTITFCDPEGNEVAKLNSHDPAGVSAQIEEVAKKYGRVTFNTFDKAVVKAKEDKKLVLYLFSKPNVPNSLGTAIEDASFKELLEKFILAKSDLAKNNADAKALSITEATLLVIDPYSEIAKAKILLKLAGKKDAKEVRKQLEETLKKSETDGGVRATQ